MALSFTDHRVVLNEPKLVRGSIDAWQHISHIKEKIG